jgi:hypothetical protein
MQVGPGCMQSMTHPVTAKSACPWPHTTSAGGCGKPSLPVRISFQAASGANGQPWAAMHLEGDDRIANATVVPC